MAVSEPTRDEVRAAMNLFLLELENSGHILPTVKVERDDSDSKRFHVTIEGYHSARYPLTKHGFGECVQTTLADACILDDGDGE